MEPWCREVGRPGGVQCVEVVKSRGCAWIGIQPGAVGTRVLACYSCNHNSQEDQSTTLRQKTLHFEERTGYAIAGRKAKVVLNSCQHVSFNHVRLSFSREGFPLGCVG